MTMRSARFFLALRSVIEMRLFMGYLPAYQPVSAPHTAKGKTGGHPRPPASGGLRFANEVRLSIALPPDQDQAGPWLAASWRRRSARSLRLALRTGLRYPSTAARLRRTLRTGSRTSEKSLVLCLNIRL